MKLTTVIVICFGYFMSLSIPTFIESVQVLTETINLTNISPQSIAKEILPLVLNATLSNTTSKSLTKSSSKSSSKSKTISKKKSKSTTVTTALPLEMTTPVIITTSTKVPKQKQLLRSRKPKMMKGLQKPSASTYHVAYEEDVPVYAEPIPEPETEVEYHEAFEVSPEPNVEEHEELPPAPNFNQFVSLPIPALINSMPQVWPGATNPANLWPPLPISKAILNLTQCIK